MTKFFSLFKGLATTLIVLLTVFSTVCLLPNNPAFAEGTGNNTFPAVLKLAIGKLSNAELIPSPSPIVHINGSDNSFVEFDKELDQFGTGDFTVAFLINTKEQHRLFDIAGDRTAGSHGNFLAIRMTGNHESLPSGIVTAEIDQDGRGTNYISVRSSATGLNDGNWHEIAVVREEKTLKLYIDGKLSASKTGSGVANIDNNNPFKLGRSLVGYERKFAPDARYEDLCVFDVALTDTEISRLFALVK